MAGWNTASSCDKLTALGNLDSVMNNHSSGVLSNTCDSPTDAISDCLNVDRVLMCFVAMSLLGCCSCVELVILWVSQCDYCKFIFVS